MVRILSYLPHFHRPFFIPAEARASQRSSRFLGRSRRVVSPSGSLLSHRLLSRSRSLCRKSPDGHNEKFSSHYNLHKHTQSRKLGRLSAWNDYFSSNGRAAGRAFIDYSLNRDAQPNTPALMSALVRLHVCTACARVRSLFPPTFIQTFL